MVDQALNRRISAELPGWLVEGDELVGRWRFPDFGGALAGAVQVGALAERADHHPDMLVGWGKLEVRLTTHSAKALTAKDVDLAAKVSKALKPPQG
jgi:4a-hydroxytetrahydrobiopterin dehydratase